MNPLINPSNDTNRPTNIKIIMESNTPYTLLPTAEGTLVTDDWRQYPGNRRVPLVHPGPPSGMVLIKTAGNALQAVSKQVLEQQNLLAVSVPENMNPGDPLLVTDGNGRVIHAIIPEGAFAGNTFMVQMPEMDHAIQATAVPIDDHSGATHVVVGEDVAPTDLEFQEQQATAAVTSNTDNYHPSSTMPSDLVLVQVPFNAMPGSTLQVQSPDGRTIEAVVPEGNVREFYVRLPPN